jgi:hypothetical protein
MSMTILKQRLRDAKKSWGPRNSGDANGMQGFVPGVLKGLSEALKIVQDYHREQLMKAKSERRQTRGFKPDVLYQACRNAYRRLQQSDRVGAMRALSRVL